MVRAISLFMITTGLVMYVYVAVTGIAGMCNG